MGSPGGSVTIYPQVLTGISQKVLRQVGRQLRERHFYLGGGTALALYLGHRKSKDFDWFTTIPLSDPLQLGKDLQASSIPFKVQQIDRGTLEGTVSRIRVSLFEYRYPLLQPVSHWNEMGVDLASLQDLAAMKLSAVAQRGTKKDFIDIYALLRNGMDLSAMFSAYQNKFKTRDIGHILYSLTYFDDSDRDRSPVMLWEVDWRTVKRSILGWVHDWILRSGNSGHR